MQQENFYPIDIEAAEETARLLLQDRLLTKTMGGVFPPDKDLSNVEDVLDVACGPGGWALEVAYSYPHIEVIGIDLSENMIRYATAQAQVQGLSNVSFRKMNAAQPLDFGDASFDLVNARFLFSIMQASTWPAALAEWYRVLRPGGELRWTELEAVGSTTSPAFEEIARFVARSLHRAGQSFSCDGNHTGIIPVMGRLLRKAGFEIVGKFGYLHEASRDSESYNVTYQDLIVSVQLCKPFLVRAGALSAEGFDQLYQQILEELEDPDYCSVSNIASWWARKPL